MMMERPLLVMSGAFFVESDIRNFLWQLNSFVALIHNCIA